MQRTTRSGQRGISLVGVIFIMAILGMIGVAALKVVPTVTEYMSIMKAIKNVKSAGGSLREMRDSFDKYALVGYIDAVHGKDLEISKNGDEVEISFAYQKKIPLVGPTSLLIDYAGSTEKNPSRKPEAKQ